MHKKLSADPPRSADDSFRQRVLQTVAAIPYGKVATYGNIAQLSGSRRAARQVGGILRALPVDSSLPWYRVINWQGKISLTGIDYQRQKSALLKEGVIFSTDESINLLDFSWCI